MIFGYIPCRDIAEAEKLGKMLVERRVAGCVNIFPVSSIYCGDDKGIAEAKEAVMIVKTTDEKVHEVEEIVREGHSYQTPCVAFFSLFRLNREYKEWLMTCLR